MVQHSQILVFLDSYSQMSTAIYLIADKSNMFSVWFCREGSRVRWSWNNLLQGQTVFAVEDLALKHLTQNTYSIQSYKRQELVYL